MTTLASITKQMIILETEIARQQAYIRKHGEQNDEGEFDPHWEQYKEDAQYNLEKWDALKRMRDRLK